MKNFITQIICTVFIFSLSFSCIAQVKQTKTASYYKYETECLEDKMDGNFIFMAWGSGSTKKEAIDQAKRNAINDILFKGINKSNCNVRPLILEVQAKDKYRNYVANLFRKDYLNYIFVEKSPKSKKKSRSQTVYGVKVKIDVEGLRNKLKSDNIIK